MKTRRFFMILMVIATIHQISGSNPLDSITEDDLNDLAPGDIILTQNLESRKQPPPMLDDLESENVIVVPEIQDVELPPEVATETASSSVPVEYSIPSGPPPHPAPPPPPPPTLISKTENITRHHLSLNRDENEIIFRLDPKECIFVKTEEGIYTLISEEGSNLICGLYFMAHPSQMVEIEFLHFDISCQKNGLLSAVDGWELNGQFFPSVEDHPIPRDARYHEFCGHLKPKKIFRMSQNVGLIEYRIPAPGQGFSVRVKFVPNPKPCNSIVQEFTGIHTLRNFGRRINCTMSIISEATFQILSLNVGQSYRRLDHLHSQRNFLVETGVIKKCKKRGMDDYVEFLGGNGLDVQLMKVGADVCGFRPFSYKKQFSLMCQNTAVRLVSSGQYDNQIEFAYKTLTDSDLRSLSLVCPSSNN